MLSPWLGVVPVVGVVTVIRAATSRGGKKRRGGLDAREDRYGCMYCILVEKQLMTVSPEWMQFGGRNRS